MQAKCCSLLIGIAWLGALPAQAAAPEPNEAFAAAGKLQADRKPQEAFSAFAAIPGGQKAAVELARGKPDEYLAILRQKGKSVSLPLAKAVEGDLLQAQGKKDDALACYCAAAATAPADAQATGHSRAGPKVNSAGRLHRRTLRSRGKRRRFRLAGALQLAALRVRLRQPSRQLALAAVYRLGGLGRRGPRVRGSGKRIAARLARSFSSIRGWTAPARPWAA